MVIHGLLIFYCSTVKAQLHTNVYWTQQTELAPLEVIYYNRNEKLSWADFKGPPPVEKGSTAAITMSGFGYKASVTTAGETVNAVRHQLKIPVLVVTLK